MKNMVNRLALIAALLISSSFAQEEMSLDMAIQEAIQNNHGLKVSKNSVEIAENNATYGMAGLLPSVSAQGSIDYGINNTGLKIVNQPGEIEATGAESINYAASIQANYTVFSGFINKNTYEQLEVNADLTEAQNRLDVENTIMQVISAYYNVLRAEENLRILNETTELSQERLHISQTKQELSGGSRMNVLGSMVDLNKDSVNVLNATYAVEQSKIMLNQVLGRQPDSPVHLKSNTTTNNVAPIDDLERLMLDQNSEMMIAKYREQVSMLDYQIARGAYMPEVNLNVSYSYNRSETEGSFLEYNRSNGMSGRISLSIPIYTGGTRKTQVQNTKIQIENNQILTQQTELALRAELATAHRNYEIVKSIYDMEMRNLSTVQENLDYVKSQFKLGLASGLQFREAQLNKIRTESNIISVRYDLRLAELELLRLTGQLVKDNG